VTKMEIQQQADQASADAFFKSVAGLGASPVPGATYRGTTSPVPLICAVGHACTATPSSVLRGQEICDHLRQFGPSPRPAVVLGRLWGMTATTGWFAETNGVVAALCALARSAGVPSIASIASRNEPSRRHDCMVHLHGPTGRPPAGARHVRPCACQRDIRSAVVTHAVS
jgi:hypothetical protein